MKKRITQTLSVLLTIGGLLFAAHYLIQEELLESRHRITHVWGIHLFFFGFTFALIAGLVKVGTILPAKVGMAYLASVVLKMFATFLFFLPVLRNDQIDNKTYFVHFFSVFFPYLIIEVLLALREIRIHSSHPKP